MISFPQLFSPAQLGPMMVKNRLVMAPMLTGFGGSNGEVSEAMLDYYAARARGGVGMIIVEAACVNCPEGLETFRQLRIDHPRYIAGLERLSRTITSHGTRAFIQIFHAGRQTSSLITGTQVVAPSPLPCPMTREIPRELSTAEVDAIAGYFINAAVMAAIAGFDGVEIHAAHGYLINQFLSPHSNQRNDRYGGSLENRMRLLLDIVSGIKAARPQLLVSVRLNIDDFVAGGLVPAESLQICQQLELCGADLIHCSVGTYESGLTSIEPASYPEGWRLYLAEAVKKLVNIPVIAGGMIRNPAVAEQVIEQGQADFVFLGRSLLADPWWPTKARRGEAQDIRPCITCNHCFANNAQGLRVACTVNPWLGEEGRQEQAGVGFTRRPRVVIVGAGPAGMQAALTLDHYDIAVSLYEKEERMGGLLNLAALPPHKQNLARLRDYLTRQISLSKVDLHLTQAYSLESLQADYPDHLIIATGSSPQTPNIRGWNSSFCFQLDQVLRGEVQIENRQVLIIGGGSNGCEVADFLLAGHNQVTIVEREKYLAAKLEKKNRRDMMNRLELGEVSKRTSTELLEIIPGQVELRHASGEIEFVPIDCVIAAVGFIPLNHLFMELQQRHHSVFLVGDAYQVDGVRQAIVQGEILARSIVSQWGRGV